MSFRQTGLCRLILLVLAVCMLAGGVFAALGEPVADGFNAEPWMSLN